ncbi:hypothetical protein H6P81_014137 [Aristolochia fimbriata]|uniref:Uncharacterized protein n=1 Tax=Aristolochia fimbriata TaxID=158543 RepID=A0AAV7EH55_ARIFI|nr:hypothetical protein H6P81_014137 [Aristolochia fimbriata]
MAASVSSDNWETLFEDAPQMDESLLMAFLEESQMLEEAEDERLGCVIRSLQEEIESRADSEEPNEEYSCGSRDLVNDGGFMEEDEDGKDYCSETSMCRVDDSFEYWVDIDVVGPCHEMGGWLLDMGVASQFAEQGDYPGTSSFSYYGEGYSGEEMMEQDYSIPLWQDSYDYRASM